MNVLQFHATAIGAAGGAETMVRHLHDGLAARHIGMHLAEVDGRGGVRIDVVDRRIRRIPVSSWPSILRPRSGAALARSAFALHRALRAARADVLHVHMPSVQCVPVRPLLALPRRWSLVVSLHGPETLVTPAEEPRMVRWQRRLLDAADAVIAPSHALVRAARALHGGLTRPMLVVPPGLGPEWFQPLPAAPRAREILYVGRLSPEKGLDLLLAAFAPLAKADPDLRLTLIGDGPQRTALESHAHALGLSGSVRFEGRMERSALPARYRRASLLALPSLAEALGLVLIEGAACGLPVVAADVGGVAEVVQDGRTGFLVKPDSAEAFTRGLARALALGPDGLADMGRAAAAHAAANFHLDATLDAVEGVYHHAIAHRGRPMPLIRRHARVPA